MVKFNQQEYLESCIKRLSVEIGARPAGSQSNRKAANFIAEEMKQAGCEVEIQSYLCPDWKASFAKLWVKGKEVRAIVNTHSPSIEIEAKLIPISTIEDIQNSNCDLTGQIALVHGEITKTGFMPKNFDRSYYADKNKDRFINLLEQSRPAAVVLVSHDEVPLPLLEDSQLKLPSVTTHRDEKPLLVDKSADRARLKIISERKDSTGANVIGRLGKGKKKILICAHYDTKHGTPGALDNASGVAAMLLLANFLNDQKMEYALELVAFGGEDSWFPGDSLYTKEYPPNSLVMAINLDGIGLNGAPTIMAAFQCSDKMMARICETAKNYGNYVQEQFYESNHAFFWPMGIPTLAFTSKSSIDLLGKIVHTENDTMDILDVSKIQQTAALIKEGIAGTSDCVINRKKNIR